MAATEIVLVTQDRPLAEALRSPLENSLGCRLIVFEDFEQFVRDGRKTQVPLRIVHLTNDADAERLEIFFRDDTPPGQDRPTIPTLVITDGPQPELALRLMRLGAADCFAQPVDLQRFTMLAEMVTMRHRLAGRDDHAGKRTSLQHLGERTRFLFGRSEIGGLVNQIRQVSLHDSNVLLTGETGTGKTMLAGVIHELSRRSNEPFVVVHCGSLSESLVESELFGHCKGAYTSADSDRVGKLAAAGQGTLLLDDIDALPPGAQAKLLRALEERVFEPVGSNTTQTVKARFIAASNRDLEEEIAAGRFRGDLFYRLNVVQFHLPPLRSRREEIAQIAQHFLADLPVGVETPRDALAPRVLQAFQQYDWPGNFRELRNVIERCAVLCQGRAIAWEDLPPAIQQAVSDAGTDAVGSPATSAAVQSDEAPVEAPAGPSLSTLANARIQAEVNRIRQALEKHQNNRKRAAEELGISRTALYKKLHRYGLMEST